MGDPIQDVTFYENVFAENFCHFLFKSSLEVLKTGRGFSRSNQHWPEYVVKASQPVFIQDYDEILSKLIIESLLKRGVIDHPEYHVANYIWMRLSYLPWHNDGNVKDAISVYINPVWERDWGGLYLYEDKASGQIMAHVPKCNTAVKTTNGVPHATTIISVDAAAPRVSIQLFPKKNDAQMA